MSLAVRGFMVRSSANLLHSYQLGLLVVVAEKTTYPGGMICDFGGDSTVAEPSPRPYPSNDVCSANASINTGHRAQRRPLPHRRAIYGPARARPPRAAVTRGGHADGCDRAAAPQARSRHPMLCIADGSRSTKRWDPQRQLCLRT